MSYGVLQEQYTTDFKLKGSNSSTGVIGPTLNGVLYLVLPLVSWVLANRPPRWKRMAAYAGLLLSSAGLIISAWSTEVWHLIVTQGILVGLGSALMYSPTTLVIDEWFARRKSFAYSIMLATKNVVGTGTPFITPALLSSMGLRNTLRVWGAITFGTGIVGLLLLPFGNKATATERPHAAGRVPWKFLTHPTFYIYLVANMVFSSGYGLPQTYVPSYARQVLHLPRAQSSLMLALLNLPPIFSSIVVGMLGDGMLVFGHQLSTSTLFALTALGSALPVLLIWGLATRSGAVGIAFFAVVYGFFSGAFSSTWGGMLKDVQREAISHNEAVDTGVVYGLMNGGRGLGFVVGGIAGIELLKDGPVDHSSQWGYGTRYGSMILYTGISCAVGGWSVLWGLGGRWKRVL